MQQSGQIFTHKQFNDVRPLGLMDSAVAGPFMYNYESSHITHPVYEEIVASFQVIGEGLKASLYDASFNRVR